jgi:hypothetical protein
MRRSIRDSKYALAQRQYDLASLNGTAPASPDDFRSGFRSEFEGSGLKRKRATWRKDDPGICLHQFGALDLSSCGNATNHSPDGRSATLLLQICTSTLL